MSNGKGGIREITLVFTLALLGVGLATLAAFTPWYEAASAESAIVDVHIPLFDPPDVTAQGRDSKGPGAARPWSFPRQAAVARCFSASASIASTVSRSRYARYWLHE